ncbi:MAG: acyl carrier protein [Oscillospiraceae bacterium]|jgi:acyl carrier protein|nr:acyl carrier protein [Oscillospiraceae bacterium]
MNIQDETEGLIRQIMPVSVPIGPLTNLYLDLGFDSLSLMSLLVQAERTFAIRFSILEMGECQWVGRLVAMVTEKTDAAGRKGNVPADD